MYAKPMSLKMDEAMLNKIDVRDYLQCQVMTCGSGGPGEHGPHPLPNLAFIGQTKHIRVGAR